MRAIILLCLFLCGCATAFTQFPQQREQLTTKTYNADYASMIDSVVKTLESMSFPIKHIDRENGIIETGERKITFGVRVYDQNAHARISKTGDNSVLVRITLKWEGEERWLYKDYERFFSTLDKEVVNR